MPIRLFTIFVAYLLFGVLVLNLSQLPLDLYSFRQAQTALSIYWAFDASSIFEYYTPVLGFPYSIPFEMPLFQYFVSLFGPDYIFNARLINYIACFILAVIVNIKIFDYLKIEKKGVFYIALALIISNPFYLYWGRSVLIEPFALLFTIVSLIGLSKFEKDGSAFSYFGFLVFLILALLQKITTVLPVIFVVGLFYIIFKTKSRSLVSVKSLIVITSVITSILIAYSWVLHTDNLKMLSTVGMLLTSDNLNSWNYGHYRLLESEFWFNVFLKRGIVQNLFGCFGLIPIMYASFIDRRLRFVNVSLFCVYFSHIFMFPNLHLQHSYYQFSANIYLVISFITSFVFVVNRARLGLLFLFSLIFLFSFNATLFFYKYYPVITENFNSSRDVLVSEKIKSSTSVDQGFIMFGNDWSSTIPLFSERKALLIPTWYESNPSLFNTIHDHIVKFNYPNIVICLPFQEYTTVVTVSDIERFLESHSLSYDQSSHFGCSFYSIKEVSNG